MENRLEGKRIIVTGAGSGIGRAIALRMADEGARVALADVDEDAAKRVAEEIGGDTLVHRTLPARRAWRRSSGAWSPSGTAWT
jgi:NAD(P)-dependent dehydrogenase (short-subunit alcohol dehydrogenase family)